MKYHFFNFGLMVYETIAIHLNSGHKYNFDGGEA